MNVRMITMMSMLAMALCPPTAIGQVFFDDFNGDALLPHWIQPPPSAWEYNVSEGMLNVTGLFSPSNPKSPSNFTTLTAVFEQQTDFQMDVVMGWEAGDEPHRLQVSIGGPFGGNPIIARMGYRDDVGSDPVVFANAGGQSLSLPAPEHGLHHFTISRTGPQFSFMFNGNLLASFQDTSALPAAAVTFFFLGPFPGDFGNFHIDSIVIVPAPSAILLIGAVLFHAPRRRAL